MSAWTDAIMVVLILTNLALLGTSRLLSCIRILALQGIVLGLLPMAAGESLLSGRALFLTPAAIGLKGIVFPMLLARALRRAEVPREVEPFVGYVWSVLAGLAALAASVWLGRSLPTPLGASSLVAPVALFMILTGLFLIVSRKKALTQVLGFVVMENGTYAFGVVMLRHVPLLVELGTLLDAFVAVFVMGIAIFHISREFDHMDAHKLDTLKG